MESPTRMAADTTARTQARHGEMDHRRCSLVAVIAVTAVVAVSCTKSSGGSDKPTAAPTTSGAPASDFASANDTGPVSVITEDPSCAPWMPILNTLADAEANGWKERDPSIPATVWSQDVRTQYLAVADAMRSAAEQTAPPLMKVTTHRVMRELYEQFIAYAEAYADHVPVYTAPDNQLALTAVGAAEVLSHICQAITYGSAAARAPLVEPAQPPTSVSPLGNSNRPVRFLTTPELGVFGSQTSGRRVQRNTRSSCMERDRCQHSREPVDTRASSFCHSPKARTRELC